MPVVALLLATLLEHYAWTLPALAGAVLCAVGNVVVLMPQRAAAA